MRHDVKHSFCQENYLNYDITDQIPHNTVHFKVGGNMDSISTAAYDPIFYLHHSFVDLQYAYWQDLQGFRFQASVSPVDADREMPPFSNRTNAVGINVNPIHLTKAFDTQRLSLDYNNKIYNKECNKIFKIYNKTHKIYNKTHNKIYNRIYNKTCNNHKETKERRKRKTLTAIAKKVWRDAPYKESA